MNERKIIHVDMDAFFASVEQRDDPTLRGRPVVVGGTPEGRGVVAAASYEARKFGIHSAMPAARARRCCPDAIFVRPRIARYREVSREIGAIFREVTDKVEPLSLDEAYLDVTRNALGEPLAGKVAQHIRREIHRRLSLTASAGVGPNKLVAKIASDVDKPDGLTIVPPDRVLDFLAPLPVARISGVGPATNEKLSVLGIQTIEQLRGADPALLVKRFGKQGPWMLELAWGRDSREVQTSRVAKSRGTERTFAEDVEDVPHMLEVLSEQIDALAGRLESMEASARTVTLKVRYSDFTTITRSRSFAQAVRSAAPLMEAVRELLVHHTDAGVRPVRLLGVSASGFISDQDPQQLALPFE